MGKVNFLQKRRENLSEAKMSDIIRASLDGVKEFAEVDTIFGSAVTTPSGVTIIPVSKITLGFAGGGLDIENKKIISNIGFGGGSGTGMAITPVAFLTVGKSGDINLMEIGSARNDSVAKTIELIENSPVIIEKIKNTLMG